MRSPVFFALVTLAGFGMVALALAPLRDRPGDPVSPRAVAGGLVVSGAALNEIAPGGADAPVSAPPGPRGDQIGPRLLSERPLDAAKAGSAARLRFARGALAPLAGQAVVAELDARGLPAMGAAETALAWDMPAGAPVWVRGRVAADYASTRFALPPPPSADATLLVWAATEGAERGIEIRAIRLAPAAKGEQG